MHKIFRLFFCMLVCSSSHLKSWCALAVPGNYKSWELCPTRVVGLVPIKDTAYRKFYRIVEVETGVQVEEVNSCGYVTESVDITFVDGKISFVMYKNQWQRTFQTMHYMSLGDGRYLVTGLKNGVNLYTPASGVIQNFDGGLCVRTDYVSEDLKTVENNYGFATIKYDRYFDAKRFGLLKSTRVYDGLGVPVVSGYEDCFRADYERDITGNILSLKHFDTSGQLLENRFGVAITDYTYDSNDEYTSISYRNRTEESAKNSLGAYKALFYYQNGLMTSKVLFGKEGALLKAKDCSSNFTEVRNTYNSFGSAVTECTFDEDGRPVKSSSGFAKTLTVYNDANMQVERSFYDTSGKPTVDKSNIHKWRYLNDNKGQKVLSASYDREGAPSKDLEDKVYVRRYYYNFQGQITEESFWERDGTTAMNRWNGCHISKNKYNEAGLQIERAYYDKDGNDAILSTGASREVFAYNKFGQIAERAYYKGLKPVMVQFSSTASVKNFHIVRYIQNGNGKTSSVAYFDTLGRPVNAILDLKEKVECHKIDFFYRGANIQMENLYKIGIVDPIKIIDCKHEVFVTVSGVGWENPQNRN